MLIPAVKAEKFEDFGFKKCKGKYGKPGCYYLCVANGCKVLFVTDDSFIVDIWRQSDPRIHENANCKYKDKRNEDDIIYDLIISGMLKSFRSKKTKDADNIFAESLIKNAKENWCDTHVEMLERLIKSTLNGTKYDETLMDKDLEDENLLLRLPCKIGDCVYKFITQHDTFDNQPYKIISAVRFDISMMDEIGKTVFLTREEAEEKLEEIYRGGK